MSLKIYDWRNGPYPARVRIALAEKGMQCQTHFVSVNLSLALAIFGRSLAGHEASVVGDMVHDAAVEGGTVDGDETMQNRGR